MGKCRADFAIGECAGVHAGKYSSCTDEALDWLSTEESLSAGGDPDYGHAALLKVNDGDPSGGELCRLQDGVTCVNVPGGWWITYTDTQGFVNTCRYDREEDARRVFDVWIDAFLKWAAMTRLGDED